uniref:Putative scf ubiquitin ligase rbx1 component n=1 Tax=Anopheles darlingi TaxID=43151 RepID=A0A2M4CT72_ANODA
MADENENSCDKFDDVKPDKMFTLKKWNAVAMWSWDVECDTCAICRVQVMGKFFQFQFPYQSILNFAFLTKPIPSSGHRNAFNWYSFFLSIVYST